jgi:predicted acyltransferase
MPGMDPKSRLISLDAFRGATIAAMILVNNPGSYAEVYDFLEHSAWHGWTFADGIFPAFLWMVGVALVLSTAKRLKHGDSRHLMMMHVLKRSAIIFALGVFLAGFPFGLFLDSYFSIGEIRIPGVLQRIALCYLLASVVFFTTGIRGQVITTLGLLIIYWALLKMAYVPGYGAGVLEPEGNLCWYVDFMVLKGHTYAQALVKGFDPEGIVSTIGALATTLFGVLAGHGLRSSYSPNAKTLGMLAAAIGLIVVGSVMDIWLPINKNLWTSSFAVFMAGISTASFAMCYWIIDVKGYQRWASPFSIFGMNALAIYVLAILVEKFLYLFGWTEPGGSHLEVREYLSTTLFESWAGVLNGSLLYSITFVLVMYLVAWAMWKKRIFIKL